MADRRWSGAAGDDGAASIIAVLRVAARHDSLLARPAFEELAQALSSHVDFSRMAVVVHEGEHHRLYAVSRGEDQTVVPFGARFRVDVDRTRALPGEPHFCDDTRLGAEIERATAAAGHLSYVSLPIWSRSRGEVVAQLVFAFRETFAARAAPLPLLEEVATVIGANLPRAAAMSRDRRLAMILDTSGDAMLAWDKAGYITDANAAASTLTGLPRDELIGADVRDLFGELPDPGHPHGRLELRTRGPAHETVIVSATITAVDDDPIVAVHALLRDRSQVAVAEQEAALHLARVRKLEQELRTLLDNVPLVIFRLAPDTGELRYLNRHAERLLGVPPTEALGTPGFLRVAHASDEDTAVFDAAVARAKRGEVSPPYEARLRWGDREEIAVRGTVYPLLGDSGEVAAIEGVLADVSAEQAARTRLVQADRLSTIGTLAAGVAHEINNPAAFMLIGLDMLDRLLSQPAVRMDDSTRRSQTDLLRELRDSIRRIVDIARDLRLFVSPPRPESGATVVDVNRTVESALSLTRGKILERAQIVRGLTEVPPVLMDDGRLAQVVVNLLVNAAQAIPKSYEHAHSVRVATVSDGSTVEIEVTDTGVGIAPGDLARIWTPFFTTKAPDTGTGLGLSISREIVERAGGTIRVESPVGDPPRGASFVISLPAAGRRAVSTPVSSPLPRVPTRRAKVLLVEDEAALARALSEEISRVHDVTVADGAERALAILYTGQRFDAVLCDLRMPGMSGEALYATVLEADPEQARAFVFMTGVGFGAELERFLTSCGRPVLEKPFATEEALIQIAKVTAHRTPSTRPPKELSR